MLKTSDFKDRMRSNAMILMYKRLNVLLINNWDQKLPVNLYCFPELEKKQNCFANCKTRYEAAKKLAELLFKTRDDQILRNFALNLLAPSSKMDELRSKISLEEAAALCGVNVNLLKFRESNKGRIWKSRDLSESEIKKFEESHLFTRFKKAHEVSKSKPAPPIKREGNKFYQGQSKSDGINHKSLLLSGSSRKIKFGMNFSDVVSALRKNSITGCLDREGLISLFAKEKMTNLEKLDEIALGNLLSQCLIRDYGVVGDVKTLFKAIYKKFSPETKRANSPSVKTTDIKTSNKSANNRSKRSKRKLN